VINARKMTPIVFCASWRPCPSASAEDESVCESRKLRLTLAGFLFRSTQRIPSITRNATTKPTVGDSTIGMMTLSQIAVQSTAVPDAKAAPTRPPISACDDDDGNPKYHVVRFHEMAPTSAARTTTSP
jgi:hypothetical protein